MTVKDQDRLLTPEDFELAAEMARCEVAAVRAVCEVEAPKGGFDSEGNVRILFEGHIFSRYTQHKFDATHPRISARSWNDAKKFYSTGANADIRNIKEHKRLDEAVLLDKDAAMMSASWGLFQIMGFNFSAAGFSSVGEFVLSMQVGEREHLLAFLKFIKTDRGGLLLRHLRNKDWAKFAEGYNGAAYAVNKYDQKLATAYERFAA